MKQILPELKEMNKHLTFAKKAFTKRGFRHVQNYINGLITLNRKTVKQISKASVGETHHSAIDRVLTEARFKQELLEARYLKKVAHLTRGRDVSLLFDDTLVKREGKTVEETQYHKDHSSNGYVLGNQFFTAMIHTKLLQLPLFPKLYSKHSESKIQMATDLIENIAAALPITRVLFDSWYSDKKLIKNCLQHNMKVVCGIKSNRNISIERSKKERLSTFSQNVNLDKAEHYLIDDEEYKISTHIVKLKSIPGLKLLISSEYNKEKKIWSKKFHLISTDTADTAVQIIRQYRIRWCIETYHRDMKQNLGFSKLFLRKKEGIVRHAIFSTLAYTILKLYMLARGMIMTIGKCIAYIQNQEMDNFIQEIIEIEDKTTRINRFTEVFKRETAKV